MAGNAAGANPVAERFALPISGVNQWSERPRSLSRDAARRLLRNKAAVAGLVVILAVIGLAILAPVVAPYSPNRQDLLRTFATPSHAHPLGTDALGRDVLSRTLFGA